MRGDREVRDLVNAIWDPTRYWPLIVVSPAVRTDEPTVDLSALVEATSDVADIVVLADSSAAWLLSENLPHGMNVYNGAVRVYRPYADPDDDLKRHPLFLCLDAARSDEVIDRLCQALVDHGYRAGNDTPAPSPPPIRSVSTPASAPASGGASPAVSVPAGVTPAVLARANGVVAAGPADSAADAQGARLPRPVPTPAVLARRPVPAAAATGLSPACAADEPSLTPAVTGADDAARRVHEAEDRAARLAVELEAALERARRAEAQAAALTENLDSARARAAEGTVRIAELTDTVTRLTERFEATVRERVREAENQVARLKGDLKFAGQRADADAHQIEALSAAVARLTGEAREAAQAADEQARRDAAEITGLFNEIAALQERARTDGAENARLRRLVRSAEDRAEALDRRLHGQNVYTDAGKQFEHEVLLAWLHTYAEDDRERFPLRTYTFGPDFLDSVASLEGVDRDRIVAACVDVISNRVVESNSRNAHPLRTNASGNAPQRVREDGAEAWRCSIQNNSASARRLMWWRLPDGTIELAKVAVHDDFDLR